MRSLSRVNEQEHLDLLEAFGTYCKTCDYSATTQKSYRRITENFLSFLEARNSLVKNIIPANLVDYVKTLMGYSYKMVEFTLCGTRAFLRFLHAERYIVSQTS
jgi:site-specific recombinase XerD